MKNTQANSLKYLQYSIFLLLIILVLFVHIPTALIFCLFTICVPFFFKKNFDFFNPYNYFFCWYFYYFGLGYFCYLIRLSLGITQKYDDKIIYQGMIFSIVVAVLLKLSLKIKTKNIKTVFINNYLFKNNLSIMLFLTILNTLLNLFYWYKLGGIPIFIRGFHGETKAQLGIGLGYIEYLQTFQGILLYLQIIVFWNKSIKSRFYFLIILYNTFFLAVLSDSRGSAVFSIIYIFILYSWSKNAKRLGLCAIFSLGILMVILATMWGAIRNNYPFITSGMVFAAEIAVEYDNYLDVINIFPVKFEFLHGKSLISCITLLFPRFLLPNKNDFLTGGEYFKEIKHHYHIRVGERMTILGEMYMNFGTLGIFVSLLVLLLLLRLMKKFYCEAVNSNNLIAFFMTFFMLSNSLGFLAGDTATAFSSTFYSLIFILLCFLTIQLMQKKQIVEGIKNENTHLG